MTSQTHAKAAAARAAAAQDRDELRAALLVERRGYVQRGLDDRVEDVDAQLAALGVEPVEPVEPVIPVEPVEPVTLVAPVAPVEPKRRSRAKAAADTEPASQD